MRCARILRSAIAVVALLLGAVDARGVPGIPSGRGSTPMPAAPPAPPPSDTPSSGASASGNEGGKKKGGFLRKQAANESAFQTYLQAVSYIHEAQVHLAEAFGLKDVVQMLEAEKIAFESSSTIGPKEARKQRETSAAANEAIAQRIAEQQQLSEEGKKAYEASLEPYSQGMLETVRLAPEVAQLTAQLGQSLGGGMSGAVGAFGKGAAIGFLVKEFPGFYKEMKRTYRQVTSYAQKIEIPIPANATEVLAQLPEDDDTDSAMEMVVNLPERIELVADGTFDFPIGLAATEAVPSAAPPAAMEAPAASSAALASTEPVMVAQMAQPLAPSPPVESAPERAAAPAPVVRMASASTPASPPPPPGRSQDSTMHPASAPAPLVAPRRTYRTEPLSRELDGP